jgi:hypothetical protein
MLACYLLPAAAAFAQEARQVEGFDRVSLEINGELFLTQGDAESLEIEASPANLSRIVTQVRQGTLHISKNPATRDPVGRVTYWLTMKSVAGLETHSSGSIRAKDIASDSLRILISSSGGIRVDSLRARSLEVLISSSGNCTLSGEVDQQAVRISSSGAYRAGGLSSREARVQLTSSGEATIRVLETLDAHISSSGNVRYYGSPPRVASQLSSSGRLVRLGD